MEVLNSIMTGFFGIIGCANLIVVSPVALVMRLVIYPFHGHDKWRLKKVFNKWVEELSEQDRKHLERFVEGSFELKRLYQLVPKDTIFWRIGNWCVMDDQIEQETVLSEISEQIPKYLLFSRLNDIPGNEIIRQQLDTMLDRIVQYHRDNWDNPCLEGFTVLGRCDTIYTDFFLWVRINY